MPSQVKRKRVITMPTDMIRVIGPAEPPRSQQNPQALRTQELRAVPQGRELAVKGESLPQEPRPEDPEAAAKVEQAVNQVNEFVQSLSRDLQFTVDDESGRTVIKVLDTETKEVIRQIPPEELLRIATHLIDAEGSSLLLKVQA